MRSVGAWGLATLLVVTPMAVGGMRWDVQLVASAAALVLLMVGAYARLGRGLRVPWPLWALVLLIPLGLFQLVPLSVDTLAALSPKAAELRRFSLADLGLYDAQRHPLSLAPAATWVALFHQAAFLAVALLAANLERHHRHLCVKALAYGGAIVAVVGLVHWAVEAERIFGLYQPRQIAKLSGYFATFVNSNTQAGYLVLCTLAALGLLARSDDVVEQRPLLAAAALCGAGAVLSGSRGGHVALLVGLVVFAALAHAREKVVETRRRRSRTLANVALLLGALAFLGALALVPEWSVVDTPKTEFRPTVWASSVDLTRDFWLTGTGRGAFGSVFPVYRELQVSGGVSHPENIVLQFASEWGVTVTAVLVVVAVVGWWHAFTGIGRAVDPVHWALTAGLAAVGLQQLVDFGFESVSLSFPVAAAFGVVLAGCKRRVWVLGQPSPRAAIATLVCALALGGLLAWQGPSALAGHPRNVRLALQAASAEALPALAKTAAFDNPADHRVPLTTARQLVAKRTGRLRPVLRWINRALYLYPAAGHTHLFAARVLYRAGLRGQSATEYRLAMQAEPWRERALVVEVAERFDDPGRLASTITRRPKTRRWLANTLVADGRTEIARTTMERVLEGTSNDAEAHLALGRACLRLRDADCVRREASWLIAHRETATGHAFRALLAARGKDPDAARAALAAGASAGVDDPGFQRTAAQVYGRLGDLDAARAAVDRLWKLVGADRRSGAAALELRARLERGAGQTDAAARAYERAYALHTKPRYAAEAVRLAARAGRVKDARRLLARALDRSPDAPALKGLDGDLTTSERPTD